MTKTEDQFTFFELLLLKDPVKLEEMKIELKEGVVLPVSSPPRRQSGAVRKFIEESVQKLLAAGFIVPSKSATASPVVVVRAANKDWRLCVDYGQVNEISVCNPFPLPHLTGVHVSCESYIDDISVFANSMEELMQRCREVLSRCRDV
jgi:hypothetical protein